MKDKDIDIYSYEKIIFVDASGDDGFSFRETSGDGSSFTFVVSCLAIDPADFEYNCNILNQMKDALHLPHTSELKSTTLRRHRFARDAYKELDNIKGNVFSLVAFKKELQNSPNPIDRELCDTSTKELSGLVHSFPVYVLTETKFLPEGARVLIVIDHLKQAEAEAIEKSYDNLGISKAIDCDTIYRDSKSEKFPLIQLADALCGSVRNYFEKTLTSPLDIQLYCKACDLTQRAPCRAKGPALKAWKKIQFTEQERIVLQLHKNQLLYNDIMLAAINTLPLQLFKRYKYINCYFGTGHKKRR
ncbi:MAG: DUF3800 domain-containing protein [Lachnospiraceae bacterium]|nr:DUF3800 domain-containing protein [Lachnospiraceae bacterium]